MIRRISLLLAAAMALGVPPVFSAERVVTAGGGITEIVYALGMGDVLVGVDSSSVHPEAATRLPQTGYARALSAEGILSLSPDLLIVADDAGPETTLDHLDAAGVRVLRLDSAPDPAAVEMRIRSVAGALGVPDRAEPVVAMLRSALSEAKAIAGQSDRKPRVLFLYARSGGTLNVSGTETAAHAMIELAGGENAVTGYAGYKPLTAEAAVAAAPDVILVTTRGLEEAGGIDGVLAHPGLALTPAAKNRRIAAMDDLLLLGFGPRLGEAVRELCILLRQKSAGDA